MNRIQRNIIHLVEDLSSTHICFKSKNADIEARANEHEKISQILSEIAREDTEWDIRMVINMFDKKTKTYQPKPLRILAVTQAFMFLLGEIKLTVTPKVNRFASIEISYGMRTLAQRRSIMDDVANETINDIVQLYLQGKEPHKDSDAMRFFLQTNKL